MVTVKEVKKVENAMGEEFYGLIVQSGAMPVKSKATGRIYLTAKTAFVATTFDEQTATSMIGQEFEGSIKKVETDPFDLYKQTLNWPDGLPPIARSNLLEGTLRQKFHMTYSELLYEFKHHFDNYKKTLDIFDKLEDSEED